MTPLSAFNGVPALAGIPVVDVEPGAVLGFTGTYGFLSNFYSSPLPSQAASGPYQGIIYPTVEHLYQAMKCIRVDDHLSVAAASSPGEAKRLGRRYPMRPSWDADGFKFVVMLEALRLKFSGVARIVISRLIPQWLAALLCGRRGDTLRLASSPALGNVCSSSIPADVAHLKTPASIPRSTCLKPPSGRTRDWRVARASSETHEKPPSVIMGVRVKADPFRTCARRSDARLSRTQVMAAHRLYVRQRMSVPKIAELLWEKFGFKSSKAAANSLYHAFYSYRLSTRNSGMAKWLGRTCSGCGCDFVDRSRGCHRCAERHDARRIAAGQQ